MTAIGESTRRRGARRRRLAAIGIVAALFLGASANADAGPLDGLLPEPGAIESGYGAFEIELTPLELPPPPVDGVCDLTAHPTGCVTGGQVGGFMPDNDTVSMLLHYGGAPDSPYSGTQLVLVKHKPEENGYFPDGSAWKCVTCLMPADNRYVGAEAGAFSGELSYPMPFRDGRRILAANYIIECDSDAVNGNRPPVGLEACAPDDVHLYPIIWEGGAMREVRLNPDQNHIGWNHLILGPFEDVDPQDPLKTTVLDQLVFVGRLAKHVERDATGAIARGSYGLEHVSMLMGQSDEDFALGSDNGLFMHVDPEDPSKLVYDKASAHGEFRGFSGDGRHAVAMCWDVSNRTNICRTELLTEEGRSQNLTSDPSYIDPIDVSPDDRWSVALETRYKDRMHYIAGLPGVPPTNQIVIGSSGAAASGYRDGNHRLFQPFLIGPYGDPDQAPNFAGQQINACATAEEARTAHSVCDPRWGTQADPRWAHDMSKLVYGQNLERAPDCQGLTPVDCAEPPRHENGGPLTYRAMVADFVDDRWAMEFDGKLDGNGNPIVPDLVELDAGVPWGTPWHAGDANPIRPTVPSGVYTLDSLIEGETGSATVQVTTTPDGRFVLDVVTVYRDFTMDGVHYVNGTEAITNEGGNAGPVTWHSNLVVTDADGDFVGSRLTSPGGFTVTVLNAFVGEIAYAGYMTSVIDGETYHPPVPTR